MSQFQTTLNMRDFITTPYLKVISILYEVKKYILNTDKFQNSLIREIEWSIQVIRNRSLYTYEFSKDKLESFKKGNNELKEFIDFIRLYNKEVIEINKKNDCAISVAKYVTSSLGIDPSVKIKKVYHVNNTPKIPLMKRKIPTNSSKLYQNGKLNKNKLLKSYCPNNNLPKKNGNDQLKYRGSPLKKSSFCVMPSISPSAIPKKLLNLKNDSIQFNVKKILSSSSDSKEIKRYNTPDSIRSPRQCSFSFCDLQLGKANYDVMNILKPDFNMFELKKIIGHDNILPLLGKTILEKFELDKVINSEKLVSFLINVSDSYLKTTLYHNSLHGADVTHTTSMIFLNSNAIEVLALNKLDLVSIIIACLGHDIGHPGLTNNYHINAQSDLALIYNDYSCLENFHVSQLFKIAKKENNNIFDKLNTPERCHIRKRIISMILSTDMARHNDIMTKTSEKIKFEEEVDDTNVSEEKEEDNTLVINRKVAELIKKEDKQFENQKVFLDFFIHAADLAHNTKLFKISLQWVELLSKEFWEQGDREKSEGLPVSFLCDRENTNVPKSQVGFINGFIIPTFEILIQVFPTLSYMVENAKTNQSKWKEIFDQGRIRGWTPPKNEKEKEKEKEKVKEKEDAKRDSPKTNSYVLNNISAIKVGGQKPNNSYFGKTKYICVHKNQNVQLGSGTECNRDSV